MGFVENLPSKGPVKKGCGIQAVTVLVVGAVSLWALLEAVKVPF